MTEMRLEKMAMLQWLAMRGLTMLINISTRNFTLTVRYGKSYHRYSPGTDYEHERGAAEDVIVAWPYGYDITKYRAEKLLVDILAYKVPDVWESQIEDMLSERMQTYRYVQFNAAAAEFARYHPV